MNPKRILILLVIGSAAAYIGSMFGPVREKIVYKDKVVTKVEDRVHVVTEIKERPDGSKDTIIIRDEVVVTKEEKTSELLKIKTYQPKWKIGAMHKLSGKPVYGVVVERYIFGNMSLGIYGRTDKEFGLSLSMSF